MTSSYTTAQKCATALGVLATGGALAILWQEPIATGIWTLKHALMPLLVVIAVATGELAAFAALERRLGSAAGFAVVFVIASALTLYSSVGSQREKSAEKSGDADLHNGLVDDKRAALRGRESDLNVAQALLVDTQRQLQADCVKGKKGKAHCDGVRTNIATYESAVAGHEAAIARLEADLKRLGGKRAARPNAEAVGELATVLGWNGQKVAAIAATVEPFAFSLCFELCSIVAFLYGLHGTGARNGRQQSLVLAHVPAVANDPGEPVPPKPGNRAPSPTRRVATVERARADVIQLIGRGEPLPSQMTLARRWGVAPGTCSKWVRKFEAEGIIARHAEGRCVRIAKG